VTVAVVLAGPPFEKPAVSADPKTLCRSRPRIEENTAGRWGLGREVNNRMQKTAVNPLTRLASRSVMRDN
jgi:hypothetical protein